MNWVISIFKHVLAPTITIFGVLAGFLTAAVSGLIEFAVLQQWLVPAGSTDGAVYLPLIIVACLEITKLVLHFNRVAIKKRAGESGDNDAITAFNKMARPVEFGLVAFSFICSLIFTANAFYYQVPDARTAENTAAIEAINATYSSKLESKMVAADEEYRLAVETAEFYVANAKQHLSDLSSTPVYTPKAAYERYLKELEDAKEAVMKAEERYSDDIATAGAVLNKAKEDAREEMDAWRASELLNEGAATQATTAGDNAYLKSFLLFFSESIMGRQYSRPAYFACVIIISLAISALLELTICISQILIALPASVLKALSDEFKIDDKEKAKRQRVVMTIVSAGVSMGIFLLYGAVMEQSYNKIQLGAGVICCLISVLVPSVIIAGKKEGWKKHATSAVQEIRTMIIKGVLTFGVFILIGILFGETYAGLSTSAIGITLGSIAGHMLHIIPVTSTATTQAI